MKQILFLLMIFSFSCAQEYSEYFDPNTNYIKRDRAQISTFFKKDSIEAYKNYEFIPFRTIAVNPKHILPGSIVFIPLAAGIQLSDKTYSDGYFLAHGILNTNEKKVQIYCPGKDNPFLNLTEELDIFEVQGVIAKSMRVRYELQYKKDKEKPTYKMVAREFTELMKNAREKYPDINQRIQYISELGKGTQYLIYNLGEGAASSPDPDPTIDFARTDCMTFCEHTLALAISDNYPQMYQNLQKIRYKNGEISYVTRNHYTIVDWLPNNNWLLTDVTKQVAPGLTKQMTKTIDRPAFYKKNGVKEEQLTNVPKAVTMTVDYVPAEKLMEIAENLKGGEIVSIATKHPAVFSAHMGIIVQDKWNNLIFRHASSPQETNEVIDERFQEVVKRLEKSNSRVGMIFMRARDVK